MHMYIVPYNIITEWQVANENISRARSHRNSGRVPIETGDVATLAELIDVNGGLVTALRVVLAANVHRIGPYCTRF